MERNNIFTSKFMDNICNTVVFLGVTMFAIDFPYYIGQLFNFNKSIQELTIPAFVVLCAYIAIMRYSNYLTVKGFELELIHRYRNATKEEKTAVKDILTLNLSCFDDEEEN